MTDINKITKEMDNRELNRLSYVYKCIKFGGSTEEDIITTNGPEYALIYGGKHITMEEASVILRFYDILEDISYRK